MLGRALLRPGRFDRQGMVDLPDVEGRAQILQIHARGSSLPWKSISTGSRPASQARTWPTSSMKLPGWQHEPSGVQWKWLTWRKPSNGS